MMLEKLAIQIESEVGSFIPYAEFTKKKKKEEETSWKSQSIKLRKARKNLWPCIGQQIIKYAFKAQATQREGKTEGGQKGGREGPTSPKLKTFDVKKYH